MASLDDSFGRLELGEKPAARRWTGARLNVFVPFVLLILAALIATFGFGHGVIYADGQPDLHIDPSLFLASIRSAWTDVWALGLHTGSMHVYDTPYTWLYVFLATIHAGPALAQRAVMFAIYLWIALAMYLALPRLVPGISRVGAYAGALAYLLNVYVIFNSVGSTPMLMAYAILPTVVAQLAGVLDGTQSVWVAAIITGLSFFAAGGINPPLLVIIIIVAAVYALMRVLLLPDRITALMRLMPYALCVSAVSLTVNFYWILPFYQYIHTVWLGGILDESTAMHNDDSSFANVLRGFGQWGIFKGDANGPWYPWAQWYVAGFFSWCISAVPVLAFASLLLRSNRRFATAFFLVIAAISVPLVVGYYHGAIGTAITTPIYDFLYTKVPDFQMFRSVYKWVWPYEFAVAGLFAIGVDGIRAKLSARPRVKMAFTGVACALPVLAFVPILITGANPSVNPLPRWTTDERALVGTDQNQRVALFPGQYLELYAWGNPNYYIENSIVRRPMVYGQLGAAPNQSADQWTRRAYRYARDGNPLARDFFRVLGVDTVLQRDDFISVEDFAVPERVTQTRATLSHDLITRVLGAKPLSAEGPERTYRLIDPLPMVYLARRAWVESAPILATSGVANAAGVLRGDAAIGSDALSPAEIEGLTRSGLSPPDNLTELAITLGQRSAIVLDTQHAHNWISIRKAGLYRIFVADASSLPATPRRIIWIDGEKAQLQGPFGAWDAYAARHLSVGAHDLVIDPVDFTRAALVEVIDTRDLKKIAAATTLLAAPARNGLIHADQVESPQITDRFAFKVMPTEDAATMGEVWHREAVTRAELPYVPTDAVTTVSVELPEQWYLLEETYRWNRSVPVSMLLGGRRLSFSVYSPYTGAVVAKMAGHLAATVANASFEIEVNGRRSGVLKISSPQTRRVHATRSPVFSSLHEVRAFSVTIHLREGYNNVALVALYRANAAIPASLVLSPNPPRRFAVAIMPDLAFTVPVAKNHMAETLNPLRPSGSGYYVGQSVGFGAQTTLAGVPHLEATPSGLGIASSWVSIAFLNGSHLIYRVVPAGGDFSTPALADLLPDTSSDQNIRILGIWVTCARKTARAPGCDAALVNPHLLTEEPLRRAMAHADDAIRIGKASIVRCAPSLCVESVPVHVLHELPKHALVEFSAWPLSSGAASLHDESSGRDRVLATPQIIPPSGRIYSGRMFTRYNINGTYLTEADFSARVADLRIGATQVHVWKDIAHLMGGGCNALSSDAPDGYIASVDITCNGEAPASSAELTCVAPSLRSLDQGTYSIAVRGDSLSSDQSLEYLAHWNPHEAHRPKTIGVNIWLPLSRAQLPHNVPPAQSLASGIRTKFNSPDDIVAILVARTSPSVLVLNQAFHPAWRASINGRSLQHLTANGYQNAWIVPPLPRPAEIQIDFTGQRTYKIGSIISLLSLALWLILIAGIVYFRRVRARLV